jgi:hypothetical protein
VSTQSYGRSNKKRDNRPAAAQAAGAAATAGVVGPGASAPLSRDDALFKTIINKGDKQICLTGKEILPLLVGRADQIRQEGNSKEACELLRLGGTSGTLPRDRLKNKTTRTPLTDQAFRQLGWGPPEILREFIQNMMDAVRADAVLLLRKLPGGLEKNVPMQPLIYAETKVVESQG